MRRLLLILTTAAALVLLPSSAASTAAVSITSTGFHPSAVTIPAGDSVTWTNNDTAQHQVVADDGSFSSPVLAAKQSYSHGFKAGGKFAYHDGLHPLLKGSVTVIPPRTVWITATGFKPSTISILTGQSVTWTNKTTANQQVVADDNSFTSQVLAPGASFSHTFPAPGTFGYHDGLQSTLKGTVVVKAPAPGESISLSSNTTAVTYGSSIELTGRVANGSTGESVTITAHPQSVATGTLKSVLTVKTAADGSFSTTVKPLIHTVYVAETANSRSDPLAVNVRPRIRLRLTSSTRAVVAASAIRGFVHRYGMLQVWRSRPAVWSSIARVRFTRATTGVSPTVITTAAFRLHVRRGLRLRVLMPFSQTRPGYIFGVSNVIHS